MALSPDNKHLAGVSYADGSIKILDIGTGQALFSMKTFDPASQYIAALAFSADGRRLAAGIGNANYLDERGQGPPADVTLWDAQSGQLVFTFKGHNHYISSLAFRPDGKRLASCCSESGPARIWDTETGNLALAIRSPKCHSVAYSADGKRLATGLNDKQVMTWDAETGQAITTLKPYQGELGSLALTADGGCLAATYDRTATLQRSASMSPSFAVTLKKWGEHADPMPRTLTTSNPQFPGVLTFSPDGKRLATPGLVVQLWDVETGQEVLALKGHTALANNQAFSPDGKRLATASRDQTAKVWDLETGQELVTLRGHTGAVAGVRFRPDGKQLATASWDGTAKIWDAETWTELHTLKQTGMAYCLAYSPDGKQLAIGSFAVATIWDAETGTRIQMLQAAPGGECIGLAYSPDGRRLAGGCGKAVFIWDPQTGREIRTLVGATDAISRVAFSPDGKRLAASGWDRTARVWDVENGNELLSFKPSSYGVAFSPSGHLLAISRPQGAVELLDGTSLAGKPVDERTSATSGVGPFQQSVAASQLLGGWSMAYTDPPRPFTAGLDDGVHHGGKASAFIELKEDHATGGVSMSQSFQALDYRGKRLRFSGYVKTQEANSGASLWMLAIGETRSVIDDMRERRILSTDWKKYEVVLDIPPDASAVRFGFGLAGTGRVWGDDFQFEVVGADVPTTRTGEWPTPPELQRYAQLSQATLRTEPLNLDFESGLATSQPAPIPPAAREIAEGWTTRSNLDKYEVGLDSAGRRVGKRSAFIKANMPEPRDSGGLIQKFRAEEYRGKRLRLSGYVKTENVDQIARMWMRIDCPTKFVIDNMGDRPITGTRDWKIYDIVLDVPEDAIKINFGIMLSGKGQAWFDDLQFEVVDKGRPTTAALEGPSSAVHKEPAAQEKPLNLDFEK